MKIDAVLFLLLIVLVAGFCVRLIEIDKPPLDFQPIRQYRSLMISRAIYFEGREDVPNWRKEIARINAEGEGTIEPPIMEYLAVSGYRLAGSELIWIPRVVASIFWCLGGLALYGIGRRILGSDWAAVISTAIYLLLPGGVAPSRAFMPDPLMVSLMLFGIWGLVAYFESPSRSRLVVTAAVISLALLVKVQCVFMLFAVFAFLSVRKYGISKKVILSREAGTFLCISLVPAALYYFYGLFIAGFLKGQAQMSFIPSLLFTKFFWEGWANTISYLIGPVLFVVGLIGILLFREGIPRATIISLWLGYLIYGLTFHYHIATHPNYTTILVPVVALSAGSIAAVVIEKIGVRLRKVRWKLCVFAFVAVAVCLDYNEIRTRISVLGWTPGFVIEQAERAGELVRHSRNCIYLTLDSGVFLKYHGETCGVSWPNEWDIRLEQFQRNGVLTAEERFNAIEEKTKIEYLIVTDDASFNTQSDFVRLVEKKFEPLQNNDSGALIFVRK